MTRAFDSFVILADMRTGSNFLEANINEMDGLRSYGEAFNPHFIGQKDKFELLGVTLQQRDRDPMRLIMEMKRQTSGLPGFRLFHDHDPRVLRHVLADRHCAKVILTRNPVESYVSLKIAAATGQWKLTNVKHRRTASVVFDAQEFELYLRELQQSQQDVLHVLQTTGQTAFHLSYEDITDIEVLNGLAEFLGVAGRLKSLSGTLKKQNPAPLTEKVSNPAEMTEALLRLDVYDLSGAPSSEPRRGPQVPDYVACRDSALLFLPIRGGPTGRVKAWMAALDGVQPNALPQGFSQKTLRQWKRRNPGHRSFTVVSHPLARAHHVFWSRVLAPGPNALREVRGILRRLYDAPLPEGRPDQSYGATDHRRGFLAFLGFLRDNLSGQSNLKVDQAWASQCVLLQGMANFALPDMVARAESLSDDLQVIAGRVGAAAPAPGPATAHPVPLEAIYDGEVEAAGREAYQRDYMMFGYGAWGGA